MGYLGSGFLQIWVGSQRQNRLSEESTINNSLYIDKYETTKYETTSTKLQVQNYKYETTKAFM